MEQRQQIIESTLSLEYTTLPSLGVKYVYETILSDSRLVILFEHNPTLPVLRNLRSATLVHDYNSLARTYLVPYMLDLLYHLKLQNIHIGFVVEKVPGFKRLSEVTQHEKEKHFTEIWTMIIPIMYESIDRIVVDPTVLTVDNILVTQEGKIKFLYLRSLPPDKAVDLETKHQVKCIKTAYSIELSEAKDRLATELGIDLSFKKRK